MKKAATAYENRRPLVSAFVWRLHLATTLQSGNNPENWPTPTFNRIQKETL
jgi:hypothetical protein